MGYIQSALLLHGIFATLLGHSFAQVEVRNPDPEYDLHLPAGYQAIEPAPPGLRSAWRRSLSSGDHDAVVVTLEILPQRIGMNASDPEIMSASLQKAFP